MCNTKFFKSCINLDYQSSIKEEGMNLPYLSFVCPDLEEKPRLLDLQEQRRSAGGAGPAEGVEGGGS
jgi:hypothetical protein